MQLLFISVQSESGTFKRGQEQEDLNYMDLSEEELRRLEAEYGLLDEEDEEMEDSRSPPEGQLILVVTENESVVLKTVKPGAIVQFREHFYQLKNKNNKYCWTILPQKWNTGVAHDVMIIEPTAYC